MKVVKTEEEVIGAEAKHEHEHEVEVVGLVKPLQPKLPDNPSSRVAHSSATRRKSSMQTMRRASTADPLPLPQGCSLHFFISVSFFVYDFLAPGC